LADAQAFAESLLVPQKSPDAVAAIKGLYNKAGKVVRAGPIS